MLLSEKRAKCRPHHLTISLSFHRFVWSVQNSENAYWLIVCDHRESGFGSGWSFIYLWTKTGGGGWWDEKSIRGVVSLWCVEMRLRSLKILALWQEYRESSVNQKRVCRQFYHNDNFHEIFLEFVYFFKLCGLSGKLWIFWNLFLQKYGFPLEIIYGFILRIMNFILEIMVLLCKVLNSSVFFENYYYPHHASAASDLWWLMCGVAWRMRDANGDCHFLFEFKTSVSVGRSSLARLAGGFIGPAEKSQVMKERE